MKHYRGYSYSRSKGIWNSTWLNVLVVSLLVISAIVFFTFYPSFQEYFTDQPSLEYFYMENCPHCVNFSPIWDDAVNKIKAANLNVVTKKHNALDSDSGGKARADKFGVTSYPTVLYIDGSTTTEYKANPRTADGLLAFVKSMQPNQPTK